MGLFSSMFKFFTKQCCKKCNGLLKKVSHKEFMGEGSIGFGSNRDHAKEYYKVTFTYICEDCGAEYSSAEILND